MKGTLGFDPATHDYGPASTSVRQILNEWASIDWFVPPTAAGEGERLLREHNALARTHQPSLFAEQISVREVRSDWAGFAALCARVRTQTNWDWKCGPLKQLCHAHTTSLGWKPPVEPPRTPQPGDLFLHIGENAVWIVQASLKPKDALPPDQQQIAEWYWSYAQIDLIQCIEWQLAEKNDRLDTNPYWPLVRCYVAGFLPFSFSRTEFELCGLK